MLKPIGIFDSGIGGLTVFEEIAHKLPYESLIYFGDTARVPYGTKSKSTIIKYSMQIARFLLSKHIKMLVIACNTSSAYSLKVLKEFLNIPVIGVIEPGVKKAIETTSNKRVGVIATSATIKSGVYRELIERYNSGIKTYSQACPLFVPLVEEGWFRKHRKIVRMIAGEYLKGIKKNKIDTLILGCTHYPLLKSIIQEEIGKDVKLINSAVSVAEITEKIILDKKLCNNRKVKSKYTFYVSDEPDKFIRLGMMFLSEKEKFIKALRETKKVDIEKY